MTVLFGYKFKADLLKFAQKTKAKFEVVENEIRNLERGRRGLHVSDEPPEPRKGDEG